MKFINQDQKHYQTIESVKKLLGNGLSLKNCIFQEIDFTSLQIDWDLVEIDNTVFLGCQFSPEESLRLSQKGAQLLQQANGLPYQVFRKSLYHWKELMEGFDPHEDQSRDWQIYQHFSKSKFNPPVMEALWQRIHDHSMDDALRDLLDYDQKGMTQKKCVGFMGGHGTLRTDPYYKKTALTSKILAEAGYFIVSGGGPGIMEATNLGAYFANYSDAQLYDAISILEKAPHYSDQQFHQSAFEVLEKYPNGQDSLAIPTWFYGHEPSNLFAAHIAKYFSNSIREDTLLAISLYGIICAPGSAGTTQEIFMDATQNHYCTFNHYSPMIFLGKKRYEIDTMIFPLLKQLSFGRVYHDLLYLTDEPEEVLQFLQAHPPISKDAASH
ncbi:MAG: hypothetical protein AAF985_19505 [Bacteroidota bacterium]